MIPVAEARRRILAAIAPVGSEQVSLAHAAGRTLAADVIARLTQPPEAVSAMDGYAVRAADVGKVPARPCASSPARRCRTAPMRS